MPIKRIERTAYFVKDWDSSVSLYRDILGLKLSVIVPRVWRHFEAPGGGRIALQLQRPNGNKPAHVSVNVSDIRSFVDELLARGVKIIEPVTKQDFGDAALIADSSGNVVSLVDLSTSKCFTPRQGGGSANGQKSDRLEATAGSNPLRRRAIARFRAFAPTRPWSQNAGTLVRKGKSDAD